MSPIIDAITMRRKSLLAAMCQLGFAMPDVPLVDDPTAESLRGKILLAPVPPRFARYARMVAEPRFRVEKGEQASHFAAEKIVRRFQGMSWFEVEDLGPATELAEVITTRHESLIAYIREETLARPDAPVQLHAKQQHVAGQHAIGILPYHVAAAARCVTNVPMDLPRGLQWHTLTVEQQRQYLAAPPFTYRVHLVGSSDAERPR